MAAPPAPTFIEYPRIDNAVARTVHKMDRMGYTAPDKQWVALEKVDGSNFAIACILPARSLHLQRRNGFLAADDRFHGAQTNPVVQLVAEKVRALVDTLAATAHVTVFGELYGNKVQSTIAYSTRDVRFIAFDLCVDGVFLPYATALRIFQETGIPHCAPLQMGPLTLLLRAFDLERLASIYTDEPGTTARHMAEGIVLRETTTVFKVGTDHDERPMLKMKRRAFCERTSKEENAVAAETAAETACSFINAARLAATRSKLLADAPIYDVATALVADAMVSVQEEDFWAGLTEGARKRVRKAMTDVAFALVKRGADA